MAVIPWDWRSEMFKLNYQSTEHKNHAPYNFEYTRGLCDVGTNNWFEGNARDITCGRCTALIPYRAAAVVHHRCDLWPTTADDEEFLVAYDMLEELCGADHYDTTLVRMHLCLQAFLSS